MAARRLQLSAEQQPFQDLSPYRVPEVRLLERPEVLTLRSQSTPTLHASGDRRSDRFPIVPRGPEPLVEKCRIPSASDRSLRATFDAARLQLEPLSETA